MIALLAAALGAPKVEVEPVSYTVGECLEVPMTLVVRGKPVDVALGSPAVRVEVDGERARWVSPLYGARDGSFVPPPDCSGDGPRAVLEPGRHPWTYRAPPVFLPPGDAEIVLEHVDLGSIRVPVRVELPEERTLAWVAATRLPVPDDRFAQPYYIEGLARLARQGVPWAASTLARMRDEPGVQALLDELAAHPLDAIRREVSQHRSQATDAELLAMLASPLQGPGALEALGERGRLDGVLPPEVAAIAGMERLDGEELLERIAAAPSDEVVVREGIEFPGDPTRALLGVLFRHAPPLGVPRLLEILRTTGSPAVGIAVVRALEGVSEADDPILAWAERCESASGLIDARSRMFERGERARAIPLLLGCLENEATRVSAVPGLLHYVAWRGHLCREIDVPRAREAWEAVFTEHRDAVLANRQLPTYAHGVPEAVAAVSCDARPSVLP